MIPRPYPSELGLPGWVPVAKGIVIRQSRRVAFTISPHRVDFRVSAAVAIERDLCAIRRPRGLAVLRCVSMTDPLMASDSRTALKSEIARRRFWACRSPSLSGHNNSSSVNLDTNLPWWSRRWAKSSVADLDRSRTSSPVEEPISILPSIRTVQAQPTGGQISFDKFIGVDGVWARTNQSRHFCHRIGAIGVVQSEFKPRPTSPRPTSRVPPVRSSLGLCRLQRLERPRRDRRPIDCGRSFRAASRKQP